MPITESSREPGSNSKVISYVNPNDPYSLGVSSFPSEEDRTRINTGHENEKIFKGLLYDYNGERGAFLLKKYFEMDPEKGVVLALSINVARTIIAKTTRFFIGGDMSFSISTENQTAKKDLQKRVDKIVKNSDLVNKLREEANALQTHGYSTMRAYKEDDEKVYIEGISYANTFPIYDFNGRLKEYILGKYLTKEDGPTVKNQYFYAQIYYFEDGTVKVAHNLYSSSGYDIKEKVSFRELGEQYADLDGRIDSSNLEEIPVKQINDIKLSSEYFATGVIHNIKSAVEEINDCLTRLSTQFIKHIQAKIAIPKSALKVDIDDNTGKEIIRSTNLEVIPVDVDDVIPQYITNSNPLIEQQFAEIEKLLDLIAASAEVPEKFVGREQKGGIEKVETKKLSMLEFLRKIEDYQESFKVALETLFEAALILDGATIPDDFEIEIKFRDGLPIDKEAAARAHALEIDTRLKSQRRAMKEYNEFSEEQVEAELHQIREEENNTFPNLGVGEGGLLTA